MFLVSSCLCDLRTEPWARGVLETESSSEVEPGLLFVDRVGYLEVELQDRGNEEQPATGALVHRLILDRLSVERGLTAVHENVEAETPDTHRRRERRAEL